MKKKNVNHFCLNKSTISNFDSRKVIGKGPETIDRVTCGTHFTRGHACHHFTEINGCKATVGCSLDCTRDCSIGISCNVACP